MNETEALAIYEEAIHNLEVVLVSGYQTKQEIIDDLELEQEIDI